MKGSFMKQTPPPRRRGLCIVRDDFSFEKSSARLRRRSSFSQKVTLATAVRLQARSRRLRGATNFLRDAKVRIHPPKTQNIFFVVSCHSKRIRTPCGVRMLCFMFNQSRNRKARGVRIPWGMFHQKPAKSFSNGKKTEEDSKRRKNISNWHIAHYSPSNFCCTQHVGASFISLITIIIKNAKEKKAENTVKNANMSRILHMLENDEPIFRSII
ncbi:MAG: hypothetical protein ACI4GZ_03280 [Ruminococcus sp.]